MTEIPLCLPRPATIIASSPSPRWKRERKTRWLIPAVTALLLTAMLLQSRWAPLSMAQADGYHRRIRNLAAASPLCMDAWLGVTIPAPPPATAMLHTNVIISRRFHNLKTGEQLDLLLVQSPDARDLVSYYPPYSYVNHGLVAYSTQSFSWQIGRLSIPVMRYAFLSTRIDRPERILVDHFIILPNGGFCYDVSGVAHGARDRRWKCFGAAQVQIVAEPELSAARRYDFLKLFIQSNQALLLAIQNN